MHRNYYADALIAKRVFVESIKTYQFRNLHDVSVELTPGMICIVGENGQGKTNIVEAISLLSFGRSFRTNDVKDLLRWKTHEASVFAKVVSNPDQNVRPLSSSESRVLGMIISEGKKKALIDGDECKTVAELFPLLRCVTFSPTDLALVMGAPGDRRRFLDRHTVDLDQALVWSYIEYQRALRSKQAVLRKASESGGGVTKESLAPWNQLMSESGSRIINARMALLSKMEPILARYSELLFGDPSAIGLKFRGPSTHLMTDRSAPSVSPNDLCAQLDEASEREIEHGRTSVGPHKDDLIPYIFGHDARSFASQGQSRSIVLVLKLAMVELIRVVCGESPVVLLDDVDSELDAKRRDAIFSSMAEQSGQLIITCTEKRMPSEIERRISQTLHVRAGEVVAGNRL